MMRPTLLLPCLLLLSASPVARVDAADAHVGVHPERGEMVLLRDVNARPAYRPAPPGIALIVDPTPNREIDNALGTGEMSDDEFAAMSTGRLDASGHQATLPQQITGRALQGSLGRVTGDGGVLSGSGMARGIGGATGAIGGVTRGIAPTVTGALSQFPTGAPRGNGP